jgi:hypothetical protein
MSGQPPNASHVLCDITFDSIATPDDDMVGHLISMATVLKAPERLNRTKEQIAEYFECCRAGMPPNPFHNWTHVFDVTQLCFTLLTSSGLDQHMSDAQTMGLFFAAIAHDLGHRGRSNAYEINEKTDLAVKCTLQLCTFAALANPLANVGHLAFFPKRNTQYLTDLVAAFVWLRLQTRVTPPWRRTTRRCATRRWTRVGCWRASPPPRAHRSAR